MWYWSQIKERPPRRWSVSHTRTFFPQTNPFISNIWHLWGLQSLSLYMTMTGIRWFCDSAVKLGRIANPQQSTTQDHPVVVKSGSAFMWFQCALLFLIFDNLLRSSLGRMIVLNCRSLPYAWSLKCINRIQNVGFVLFNPNFKAQYPHVSWLFATSIFGVVFLKMGVTKKNDFNKEL